MSPLQHSSRAARALAAALCALLFASAAEAQTTPVEFPVDNFRVAPSSRGYYVTEDGKPLPHLFPSVQLWGNYARSPLVVVDEPTGDIQHDVIRHRGDLDLMIAMGFFDVLELGLVLPATVWQKGDRTDFLDRSSGADLGGGFRDIRIVPKVRIAHDASELVNFTLALPVSVPSGKDGDMLGEPGPTFYPHLILSFDSTWFDLALNAGMRIRKDNEIAFTPSQPSLELGHQVFGSLGMRIGIVEERAWLVGDIWMASSLREQDPEEVPLETMGGVRVRLPGGVLLNTGAGAGVTEGLGTPRWRVMVGVGWEHEPDPDRDKDGLENDVDKCPDDPEDMDEFEDRDGCPEPDNDKDEILDKVDDCPNDPEDVDNFEDDDGCPEKDNDGDGIEDAEDRCPLEPEDKDNFEDSDGCPDPDNDGDGIEDTKDQCPLEKEDLDQYEDEDGCPELDNDGDGLPDTGDKCPLEPEDKDGFEDGDGCPELDNDRDGFPDAEDKCPNQPEVRNGFEDDDGCPDKAKGPIKIVHGKIETPPVFFATGKDKILKKSLPLMDKIAQTFLDNPWIKKVRVEGHTDNRGKESFNMDLSKRRAASVMRALTERGVDTSRLESEGYGQTRPVADNKKRKGRAKNRRVDFVIIDPVDQQTEVIHDHE